MPDPWVQGDDLVEHEKAVESHPLTKVAKKLSSQEDDLAKEAEKRREQYVEEGGLNADLFLADTTVSAEAVSEPAGNVDSTEPTQKDKKVKDDK